ncbi:MAG TPA: aa3-type cytochrome c oxidase subunit IV [Bauldia sp.]|nr:aa3-type cytochrome c oxidase subunit IV [Bauldia sp.]
MADHAAPAVEMGGVVEYTDHLHTYEGFLKLLKYATAAIIVILILMAYFLL